MNAKTEPELRATQWTLVKPGLPIFHETAWTITIVDEAAGEFLEIENHNGKVGMTPEEWPALRSAIDRAVNECRVFPEEAK